MLIERKIRFRIGFDKPKNATLTTNIEFNLEFDTDEKRYWEEVIIGSGHYKFNGWFEDEKMEWKLKNLHGHVKMMYVFILAISSNLYKHCIICKINAELISPFI